MSPSYKNFCVNFLKKVAQWEVNEEKKGNNGSNEWKRVKCLVVFMFLCKYSDL